MINILISSTAPNIHKQRLCQFDVYSIGPNGDEQLHGDVNGSLIAYNANLNGIIDADADSTGGSLNRSGFNASGQLEFIQTADQDTGGFFGPVSFPENISISASGQQMAIAGGAGSSVSDHC